MIELKGGYKINMKKIMVVSLILGLMLMTMSFAVAGKDSQNQNKEFALLKRAVEVAPGVFYLGKAFDKGRIVEGYAFLIKDKKEFAKTVCGDGKCHPVFEDAVICPADCGGEVPDPEPDPTEPDTSSCYTFLASGAKWKSVEPYLVDTANTRNLNDGFIRSNLATDIGKWENAVNGFDILGEEGTDAVDRNNIGNLNGANEVMFADIDSQGAIGVTIIWGIFGGKPSNRVLVEWDMVFDDVDFDWSATGEAGKMDFENIATHELGHAVGMGDLYTSECSEQTMYGYAGYGETKKRTLESGDIAGINKLY